MVSLATTHGVVCSSSVATMFWYGGDSALSTTEMEHNATNVYTILSGKGYKKEVICAILGNMQAESTINPNRTEIGEGGGYGLVQWTPESKLETHAKSLGYSNYTEGETQLEVLNAEIMNVSGVASWYTSSAFIENYYSSGATKEMIDVTGEEFKLNANNFTVEELTILFMVGYERPSYDPSVNHIESRKKFAMQWLEFFGGSQKTKSSFKWWLYLKKF